VFTALREKIGPERKEENLRGLCVRFFGRFPWYTDFAGNKRKPGKKSDGK